MRTCLARAIRGTRPVVLDLTDEIDIDRSAINMLLDANHRLATRLRLVVERGGRLHHVLRGECIAHVLSPHGSLAEATVARRAAERSRCAGRPSSPGPRAAAMRG